MNILILGGTGAIGTPLIDSLNEKKYNVFVTSRKRHEDYGFVKYIYGNAMDFTFVKGICEKIIDIDVIIDFMVYELDEFNQRYIYLLEHTKQYIFISSSRVYANSSSLITEKTSRLLDTINDEEYLKTNEYALKKAREEDLLIESTFKNWTIVRPYITYNNNRLQLGTLEKEYWLRRAIEGKKFIITRKTYEAITSLTYGLDVSNGILEIIGNKNAYSECIQIVTNEYMTWKEIVEIYLDAIEEQIGIRPKYIIIDDYHTLCMIIKNKYQMVYDRFFDRKFDSSKLEKIIGHDYNYVGTKQGLRKSINEFFNEKKSFLYVDWAYEGYVDRLTNEITSINDIPNIKNKLKYFVYRFAPLFLIKLKNYKK